MRLKALIFDVDGTLAETEEAHRRAFNRAFAGAGHDWVWSPDLYRRLLETTGGRERIVAFLNLIGEVLPVAEIGQLHRAKNAIYERLVADGEVALRPGVARLIGEAHDAGVVLAIATTTSFGNLCALLDRHFGESPLARFGAVVTGEDVAAKKPDPQAYTRALALLRLGPDECLAIEDSRNGMIAAQRAGLAVLVTPSHYTDHEAFDGATLVQDNLDQPHPVTLADLEALLASAQYEPASAR